MDSINTKRKILEFDEREKAAYDLGLIDENAELTRKGKDLYIELLFEEDPDFLLDEALFIKEAEDGE